MLDLPHNSFNETASILMDTAPSGCILFDQNLSIAALNQKAKDLFGLSQEQNLSKIKLKDLLPEHQPDGIPTIMHVKNTIAEITKDGRAKRFLCAWNTSKDLLYLEATFIGVSHSDKTYSVTHFRELGADCVGCFVVSDNNNLIQRLEDMLDHMPIMCNTFDKDFRIIDCNQKSVEVFEMQNKQEFMDRFFEISPPLQPCGTPSPQKAVECIAKAFNEGFYDFDWMDKIPRTGELVPSHVSLIRFEWKNELYVVAFIYDMREFHKLQEVERATRERMQYMLDSSPLACFLIDEHFNITEVNHEFYNLFGLSNKSGHMQLADEVTAFFKHKELSPKYQPDGRLSSEKGLEKYNLALEKGSTNFEWMHQTLTKEPLPCEVTLVRVTQGDKHMVIAYVMDLRAFKHAASMMDKLEHLEKLAYTDPLTGASNRRYFMEIAERELNDCISRHRPFSVVMIDVDKFKEINDNYGHGVGDEVLKILISRTSSALRQQTVVARYGGEEFIVLLPNVDTAKAKEIALRMKEAVGASPFHIGSAALPVTISLGVGSKNDDTKSLPDIINNADKALYAAKASGRNAVITYTELEQ